MGGFARHFGHFHAVEQNRKLKDGELLAYWVQCNNNMQAGPNMNEEALPGYRNPANFIVVSDPYPTVTAQAADLTAGICRPAIYRVTVAWQGMLATVAPGVTCGQGLYGTDDGLRKAISAPVVAPLLGCI